MPGDPRGLVGRGLRPGAERYTVFLAWQLWQPWPIPAAPPTTHEDIPHAQAAALSGVCQPLAIAGPQCTTADKAQWQDQAKFQETLKAQGYEIKKFKVTDGNCYEIYGWDKDKRKVEIYYDPVSGKAVKEEIDD